MSIDSEILNRLTRIESKVVRGFEELGIDIDVDPNWMTVDEPSRTLYVSSLARSLKIMNSEARRRGASHIGKEYDVVHRVNVVATLTLAVVT